MIRQFILTAFLAAMILSIAPFSLSANLSKWEAFYFNGQDFQIGSAGHHPSIWLRDGYMPRIEEPHDTSPDDGILPPKTGAVAGICYIQITGGKLAKHSGSRPLPNEQITIKSLKYGNSIARSDSAGFFIEELLPGDYQLFCRGSRVEVRAKEGQTVLVPIRGAKRMTD